MNPTPQELRKAFHDAKPREQRATSGAEFREAADGTVSLAGYASVTGVGYRVSDWAGEYTETVKRGAFAKSIAEAQDVRLLVNHEGVPLARTTSGTLTLREVTEASMDPQGRSQTGLWVEANLDPASPLVQTLRSAMARGDMSEMSFGFQVTRQQWSQDYAERDVLEVRLFDVSVVTYPANPATSVQLNSAKLAGLAGRMTRALNPEDQADLQKLLALLYAADVVLDEAQEELSEKLGVPNLDDDAEVEEPEVEVESVMEPEAEMAPMRDANLALLQARLRAA